MFDYQSYYASIEKPFFAPPDFAFGIAWGIIYPLIAIAFVYLVYLALKKRAPWPLVALFAVNIVANLLFTPLQLGYPGAPWASIDIVVILATLGVLMWHIFRYSKIVCALLVPYLLWGAFATVLQITIYVINFI